MFRTYEPTRDRLVAVKVFRLDIVPEQAKALADALSHATEAGLFHPSIVEPIASGVEGSVAYRAEEYVAAESLDVAMRHYAPASVEKALPFVTQLAGAIDFARAAGIGHGGLHPRDIFITPDEARATGFGVVESLDKVGIRAPVRRPYSAPERIDGQPWGVAADIFSLAAITFELLTGRRPAGIGQEAGTLPDIPNRAAVQTVLARAMDRDPARRHGTALAFAAALESAWRGETAGEEPAPASIIPAAEASPTPEPTLFDRDEGGRVEPTVKHHPSAHEATVPVPLPLREHPDSAAGPSHEDELVDEDSVDSGTTLALHAPHHREPSRFADEFTDEQETEGENRRPLEAEGEPALGFADEKPGLHHHDRAPVFTVPDEERAHGLAPYIAVAVVGLILGFAAAYFMWGRNAVASPPATTAASGAPSPATGATASPPPASSEQPTAPAASAASSKPKPPPAAPESTRPSTAANPASPSRTSSTGTPTRGEINVRSTPSRAGVTLNGKWRGRTPLTLDALPFGDYVVRIVQPDYKPARQEFRLDARNPSRTMNVRLESDTPAAPSRTRAAASESPRAAETFTGTLFVDSHPQGATVVIDGKPVGKTPLRLSEVRIGTHVVRLELLRHRPWFSTARVVSGQEVRVAGSLEEIQ